MWDKIHIRMSILNAKEALQKTQKINVINILKIPNNPPPFQNTEEVFKVLLQGIMYTWIVSHDFSHSLSEIISNNQGNIVDVSLN